MRIVSLFSNLYTFQIHYIWQQNLRIKGVLGSVSEGHSTSFEVVLKDLMELWKVLRSKETCPDLCFIQITSATHGRNKEGYTERNQCEWQLYLPMVLFECVHMQVYFLHLPWLLSIYTLVPNFSSLFSKKGKVFYGSCTFNDYFCRSLMHN